MRQQTPAINLLEQYPTVLSVDGKWQSIHDAADEIESRRQVAGKLLSLNDEKRNRARRELESMGLPRDCWFASLHVREDVGTSRRDGNIADYLPAIRRIAQSGGWVVRIGDPSMTKQPDLPNLIDCAHQPRRECPRRGAVHDRYEFRSFFVAGTFGVPALLTNWPPIGIKSLYRNKITLPKRLWSQTHNRLLAPDEENSEPFASAEWTQLLDQHHVSQIPNAPEEIAAAADEMMRRY